MGVISRSDDPDGIDKSLEIVDFVNQSVSVTVSESKVRGALPAGSSKIRLIQRVLLLALNRTAIIADLINTANTVNLKITNAAMIILDAIRRRQEIYGLTSLKIVSLSNAYLLRIDEFFTAPAQRGRVESHRC